MLEPVIDHINTELDSLGLFGQFFGLCEVLKESQKDKDENEIEITFPAEYCTNDEYKHVLDSDFKKGVVYHRKTANLVIAEDNDQVISGCDVYQEYTYALRLVVVVTKNILTDKNNDQWIADKLVHNITNAITTDNDPTLNTLLSSDVVSIEVTGSNTDRYDVWDEETSGIDMRTEFNFVMIAVDYEVTIAGSQDCFQNYGCVTFAPVVHFLFNQNLLDSVGSNNMTAFTIGDAASFTNPPSEAFTYARRYPTSRDAYDRRNGGITGITQGNIDRAICVWVKWETPTASQTLTFFGSGLNNNLSIYSSVTFYAIGGATIRLITTQAINTGTWEHVIFQYHVNNDVELYINNVLVDSGNIGGNLTYADGDIMVASNPNDPNNPSPNSAFRFHGDVVDVRFYERDLSPSERAAIYNGGQGTAQTSITV